MRVRAPLTEKITRAHFGADLLTLDASKLASRAASARLSLIARFRSLLCMRAAGKNEDSVPGARPELAERFAAALRAAAWPAAKRFAFRAERMRAELIKAIMSAIPRVYINESRMQAPHILNLSLPGRDTDYLIALMDEAGLPFHHGARARRILKTARARLSPSRATKNAPARHSVSRGVRMSGGANSLVSRGRLHRRSPLLTAEANGSIIVI